MSIGLEVWALVEEGYDVPKVTPTEAEDKKKFWEHAKELNTLQAGISKKVLAKVLTWKNAKELQNKFETIYAGDSKVRMEKLQSLKVQYESIKMKDEENILEYFETIDNLINTIKGLGVQLPDDELVEKVLRTLPMAYNPKLSTLEDREKLEYLTMDELYGILTSYELILGIDNLPKGEESFKVIKKTNQKQKLQTNHDQESDEEDANFVKRNEKGSGKYKGKLPFKCFNCGRIGHFQAKCPHPKEESEDED